MEIRIPSPRGSLAFILVFFVNLACSHNDTIAEPADGSVAAGTSAGGTTGTGGAVTSHGGVGAGSTEHAGGAAGSSLGSGGASNGGSQATGAGGAVTAASATCGSATCNGLVVLGTAPLPGCCASGDQCGLDLTQAKPYVSTLPTGCHALDEPGPDTTKCPDVSYNVLLPQTMKGCCRPNGVCGMHLDLSQVALVNVPDLGCVDAVEFGVTYPASGGPEACAAAADGGTSTDGGAADSGPS